MKPKAFLLASLWLCLYTALGRRLPLLPCTEGDIGANIQHEIGKQQKNVLSHIKSVLSGESAGRFAITSPCISESPSVSPTPSVTPSSSITPSPSITISPSPSASASVSPSPSKANSSPSSSPIYETTVTSEVFDVPTDGSDMEVSAIIPERQEKGAVTGDSVILDDFKVDGDFGDLETSSRWFLGGITSRQSTITAIHVWVNGQLVIARGTVSCRGTLGPLDPAPEVVTQLVQSNNRLGVDVVARIVGDYDYGCTPRFRFRIKIRSGPRASQLIPPTPSTSSRASSSTAPTVSSDASPSVSSTPFPTASLSSGASPSASASVAASSSADSSLTPSPTPSTSESTSTTPSVTPSRAATTSSTPSPTTSISASSTATPLVTASMTASFAATPSLTPSPAISTAESSTPSPSIIPSPSVTSTACTNCRLFSQYCDSSGVCNDISYDSVVSAPGFSISAPYAEFNVAMISDIQFYYTNCKEQPDRCIFLDSDNGPQKTTKLLAAAARQAACVTMLTENETYSLIIDGGDLTNTGAADELAEYTSFLGSLPNIPTALILGNHDYYLPGNIPGSVEAARMITYIEAHLGNFVNNVRVALLAADFGVKMVSIPGGATTKYVSGSLMYAIEVEGVVFVMMHWAPALKQRRYIDEFAVIANCPGAQCETVSGNPEYYDITDGYDWLTTQLIAAEAAGKKVVLCPHYIAGLVKYLSAGNLSALRTLVENNVIAVLTGHDHDQWGYYGVHAVTDTVSVLWRDDYTTLPAGIPVYYGGSASYEKLLAVKFQNNGANTATIVDQVYTSEEGALHCTGVDRDNLDADP